MSTWTAIASQSLKDSHLQPPCLADVCRESAEQDTASSLLSAQFSFHQAIKPGGGHLDGRFVHPLGQRKLQLRLLPSSSFPRSSRREGEEIQPKRGCVR